MILQPKELLELINLTDKNALNIVYYYIGKGDKIRAIKKYREITNDSLYDSKQTIEEIMRDLEQE